VAAKKIKDGEPVKESVIEGDEGKVVRLGTRRTQVREGLF
jgi:hypothetical protein